MWVGYSLGQRSTAHMRPFKLFINNPDRQLPTQFTTAIISLCDVKPCSGPLCVHDTAWEQMTSRQPPAHTMIVMPPTPFFFVRRTRQIPPTKDLNNLGLGMTVPI